MRAIYWPLMFMVLVCSSVRAERLTVYAEDAEPDSYYKNGVVQGANVDLTRQIVTLAGFDADIRVKTWPAIMRLIDKHEPVIFFPLARTPERENKYTWIALLKRQQNEVLFKRKDRTDIQIKKLTDVQAYKVGAIHGDVRERYFLDNHFAYDPAHGLVAINSNSEGMALLRVGRIDLLPLSPRGFAAICEDYKMNCQDFEMAMPLDFTLDLYLAANQFTPEIVVERLRQSYKKSLKNGVAVPIIGAK